MLAPLIQPSSITISILTIPPSVIPNILIAEKLLSIIVIKTPAAVTCSAPKIPFENTFIITGKPSENIM